MLGCAIVLLFRRDRPVHAFVRSTTQRLRTGVKPVLPEGRGFTSISSLADSLPPSVDRMIVILGVAKDRLKLG